MNKTLQLFIIFFLFSVTENVFAQNNAIIKGRFVNKETGSPAGEVQITLPLQKQITTADAEGRFTISQIPFGSTVMIVEGLNFKTDTITVTVNEAVVDIGTVELESSGVTLSQGNQTIPTISMDDNNGNDEDESTKSQSVSSVLGASRDPFVSAVSFVFSNFRFQLRGYDRTQQTVWINGTPMNDIETGNAQWNLWGGLNDVFRSRGNTQGLEHAEYGFGGLNGSAYIDATALSQTKQTRLTYSLSNRQYTHRIMLTQSSGLMKNGWAYSFSLSTRLANEGYVPGTFYEGYSYFAAISKKIKNHQINLTAFGAPVQRGKSSPTTKEVYDLAGTHFYNPNWGFQGDEKRNARVANNFQPVFILNYQYTPSEKTSWNTTIAYQFGKSKNSGIDWYNASDPRPDYYRYLPSYQTINGNNIGAEVLTDKIKADPEHALQLNWDRMYNDNYMNTETIFNANGEAGKTVTGHRSLYVLSNDVDDVKKWSFNTNLIHSLNSHITLYTGITLVTQQTENYRQLDDLLGGDFFVNYNQFAARDYVGNPLFFQNDIDKPNRIIKVGDKYGYDYINRFNTAGWWGQSAFVYNKFDFFISANVEISSFLRDGLYRNGLFADNSFGKSKTYSFTTYGVKGGATYKLNGRNYLFLNGCYSTEAPAPDNTFISSRTRNTTISNPEVQKIQSVEGGYLLRIPKVSGKLTGYATEIKDMSAIKRFYNDDPDFRTFVNYVLQGINARYTGIEFALDVKVNSLFSVTGVAAVGQAFYTDRPRVTVYKDNDTTSEVSSREVYLKNYYLPTGPQSCYTLGLNYRGKKYWFANLNVNYADRNYADVNPDRLTPEAIDMVSPDSEMWNKIIGQEKLPSAFTVDLSLGKSFRLSKIFKQLPYNSLLFLNASMSNLLNNQNIVTGGFEQLRYDFVGGNPDKFPNKYFYGYGRTFFVNVSFKF